MPKDSAGVPALSIMCFSLFTIFAASSKKLSNMKSAIERAFQVAVQSHTFAICAIALRNRKSFRGNRITYNRKQNYKMRGADTEEI